MVTVAHAECSTECISCAGWINGSDRHSRNMHRMMELRAVHQTALRTEFDDHRLRASRGKGDGRILGCVTSEEERRFLTTRQKQIDPAQQVEELRLRAADVLVV